MSNLNRSDIVKNVKYIILNTISLSIRQDDIDEGTRLLGVMPELDSMAVVAILIALEDIYHIQIEDDEISSKNFLTVGTLVDFVMQKII